MTFRCLLVMSLCALLCLLAALPALAFTIERVSVASDGTQGNGWSGYWGLAIRSH